MLTFKPHKSTLWGIGQEETRYNLFKDGNQLFHKNEKEVSIKFDNYGLYNFHIEIFNNFIELCKLDDIIFNIDEVKQLELFFTEGLTIEELHAKQELFESVNKEYQKMKERGSIVDFQINSVYIKEGVPKIDVTFTPNTPVDNIKLDFKIEQE